jgi:H+/Cl- antiporter ClcA
LFIGTIATHFFGGSAGREGTALQMAGLIADQFSKPFKLSASDRKILIISAVAVLVLCLEHRLQVQFLR